MFERVRVWTAREWMRAVFVTAVVALVLSLLYRARAALPPFLLGLLFAYLVLPAVNRLQRRMPRFTRRRKLDRILAIIIVYTVAAILIAGFLYYLVPVIVSQIEQLIAARDAILAAIEESLTGLRLWYKEVIPEGLRDMLQGQLQAAGAALLAEVRQGILQAVAAIGNLFVVLFGYLIIPVWLFLILYDTGEYREEVSALLPQWARADALSLASITDDVLGAYVRGQLTVAAIVGTLTGIALSLLGVPFALLLGVLSFFGDLIPTLGPILVTIPTAIIAGLQEPVLALWAVLALIAVQQFESAFIGPRIIGQNVRLRPALIILVLVISGELWGFIGLLVAVPLFALARDIIRYVNMRTWALRLLPDEALRDVRHQRRTTLL